MGVPAIPRRPWGRASHGLAALVAVFLANCAGITLALAQVPDDLHAEAGQILLKEFRRDGVTIGQYWQYLPAGTAADYRPGRPVGTDPLPIVVLVHGSITTDAQALNTANLFILRSTADADAGRLALIAPVFSATNFNGVAGGYRGLLGRNRAAVEPRKTDADGFVNGILDAYSHKHPEVFPPQALFYGHSAGGQFLSRYLVMHPDRIAAMVISAAGTYAFPDPDIRWTDGMALVDQTINWTAADPPRRWRMDPTSSRFRRAARLPVVVVVGNSEACHVIPNSSNTPGFDDGTNGTGACPRAGWSPTGAGTRYRRGELWVQAMRNFADLDASAPGAAFQSLPGIGHSSQQTQPVAFPILVSNRPTRFHFPWQGVAMAPIVP